MDKSQRYRIFLINLDRSEDRLSYMANVLKERGIAQFERISAVDGISLKGNEYILQNRFKRELALGEIGCYLSHLKALEYFLESELDFAVILEDDVSLTADFRPSIEKAMDSFPELQESQRWDLLKLYNRKRRNIPVRYLDETHFIGCCGPNIPTGALGTIWTRSGAQKFLNKIKPQSGLPVIGRPVDCDLRHPWEFGLVIFNLLPSPVKLHNHPSVIGESRGKKHAKLLGALKYETRRIIPKYDYYIRKFGVRKFVNSFVLKKNKLIP